MHTIASCIDGQIKLVGGIFETRGRVEICFNQRWETFSHDKWTAANSFVTCSELGFSSKLCVIVAIIMINTFLSVERSLQSYVAASADKFLNYVHLATAW